jgi:hypothetical protein
MWRRRKEQFANTLFGTLNPVEKIKERYPAYFEAADASVGPPSVDLP